MIDDIPSELGSEEKVSNVEMKVCDVPDIDSKLQNFDLYTLGYDTKKTNHLCNN